MKLRGIRHRLRGWRLHRYVERCRFTKIVRKRSKYNHHNRRISHSILWDVKFELKPGDERFVTVVHDKRFILEAGMEKFHCPKDSLIITLPQRMDFEENYDDSARVISIFRRALESGRRISYINFANLESISPACIMAFASYADIWKRKAPEVHTRCETWNPSVEEAFVQLGVFEMLKMQHERSVKNVPQRKYMPLIAQGIESREGHDVGGETKRIRKAIEKFIGKSLSKVRMYDSVTEAIFNVRNHAYKGMQPGRLPFRWWFSVSYDEHLNELGIILFDHGFGIPATMETSTKFSRIKKLLSLREGGWSESSRLYVAFERDRRKIGSARPFVEGRGHGCQDIARLILRQDQNRVGIGSSLSVISGRARYDLSSDEAADRGISKSLNQKLQGTLIEWRIKL